METPAFSNDVIDALRKVASDPAALPAVREDARRLVANFDRTARRWR